MKMPSEADVENEAELSLLISVLAGTPAILDANKNLLDRKIRATFLRDLLFSVANNPRLHSVNVKNAFISGHLELESAKIPATLRITSSVFEMAPNLNYAEIDHVSFEGCYVPALTARSLKCKGDFRISEGFFCGGTLDIRSANISGNLMMNDSVIMSGSEVSILGSWSKIGGQLQATRIITSGKVQLIGVGVQGIFSLLGATLGASKGTSLDAERISVGETLFMKGGFFSAGVVALANASVGGGLDMGGARLGANARKRSLVASRISVERDITLRGSYISGAVSLKSARVRGDIVFRDAFLSSKDSKFSIDLDHAHVNRLDLSFKLKPSCPINLYGCKVAHFVESKKVRPPAIQLSNFSYETFETVESGGIKDALSWINLDSSGFSPQAYDRLSSAYVNSGRAREARLIMIAKERAYTSRQKFFRRIPRWIFDALVSYGYQPLKSAMWVIFFVVIGGMFFSRNPPQILESAPDNVEFNPYIFSADAFAPPFIKLGHEELFVPIGNQQYVAWALMLLGWALSIAVVAGVTKAFSKP